MSPSLPTGDSASLSEWFERAQPTIRVCKTPDGRRVVGAWMLYKDIHANYPMDKGWDPPLTSRPLPYKIVPIEAKGRGMIATRSIKAGELIIRERPVIMLPELVPTSLKNQYAETTSYLLQVLYVLEQEDREKVVSLSNCKPLDVFGPLVGLAFTNCLGAVFKRYSIWPTYAAICLEISYVNHSCSRNSCEHFDEETITFSLRAERDISAGEEITMSYVDCNMPRTKRRKALLEKYSFECNCVRCSAPAAASAASDKRRKFISENIDRLEEVSPSWDNHPPHKHPAMRKRLVEFMENLLRDVDEEKLFEQRKKVLENLAYFYAAQRNMKKLQKTMREILAWLEARIWAPGNAAEHAKWKGWFQNPTLIETWGAWC